MHFRLTGLFSLVAAMALAGCGDRIDLRGGNNGSDNKSLQLAGPAELEPTEDATIAFIRRNKNFGNDSKLIVANGRRALLQFNVPEADGEEIKSARLELQARFSDSRKFEIRAIESDWDEATVTWADRPTSLGEYDDIKARTDDGVLSVDVTALVSGPGMHSFKIAPDGFTLRVSRFHSRGVDDMEPRLVIEYGDRPDGMPNDDDEDDDPPADDEDDDEDNDDPPANDEDDDEDSDDPPANDDDDDEDDTPAGDDDDDDDTPPEPKELDATGELVMGETDAVGRDYDPDRRCQGEGEARWCYYVAAEEQSCTDLCADYGGDFTDVMSAGAHSHAPGCFLAAATLLKSFEPLGAIGDASWNTYQTQIKDAGCQVVIADGKSTVWYDPAHGNYDPDKPGINGLDFKTRRICSCYVGEE